MEIHVRLVLHKLSVQTQISVFFLISSQKATTFSSYWKFSSLRKLLIGGPSRHTLTPLFRYASHSPCKKQRWAHVCVFHRATEDHPEDLDHTLWRPQLHFLSGWGKQNRQSFKFHFLLKKNFPTANIKCVGRPRGTGKLQLQSPVYIPWMHQSGIRIIKNPHKLFLQLVPDQPF